MKMKQKPLKITHIYWSDTLFLLFKVSPTGRNAHYTAPNGARNFRWSSAASLKKKKYVYILSERVFLHEYKSINVQTSEVTSLYVYTFVLMEKNSFQ